MFRSFLRLRDDIASISTAIRASSEYSRAARDYRADSAHASAIPL